MEGCQSSPPFYQPFPFSKIIVNGSANRKQPGISSHSSSRIFLKPRMVSVQRHTLSHTYLQTVACNGEALRQEALHLLALDTVSLSSSDSSSIPIIAIMSCSSFISLKHSLHRSAYLIVLLPPPPVKGHGWWTQGPQQDGYPWLATLSLERTVVASRWVKSAAGVGQSGQPRITYSLNRGNRPLCRGDTLCRAPISSQSGGLDILPRKAYVPRYGERIPRSLPG